MNSLKRALALVAAGLALLFFSPLGIALVYGLQTWPLPLFWSSFLSPGASFLQLAGWFVALFAFPVVVACVFLGGLSRRHWLLYALGGLWALSVFSICPFQFKSMRRVGLEKSVAQLRVLPPALEKFRRQKGSYPAQLNELVPKYLNQIPATGMVAYPALRYRRADATNNLQRYELKVLTSAGFFNFDALFYLPDGYEDLKRAGKIERIGAWAYLHE